MYTVLQVQHGAAYMRPEYIIGSVKRKKEDVMKMICNSPVICRVSSQPRDEALMDGDWHVACYMLHTGW